MQNDEPVLFGNLLHLVLLVDDSMQAGQIPVIASFLKGLRNLKTLTIKCDQKSHVLNDPNVGKTVLLFYISVFSPH